MKTKNKSRFVPWGKSDRWQAEFFAGYQYKQFHALSAGHNVRDCKMFDSLLRYDVDEYKTRMDSVLGSPAFCYGYAAAAWIESQIEEVEE